jgi:methionyl-tRNA synthetase
LDLTSLEPQLNDWVKKSSKKGDWSQNSIRTTEAWIETGLKPRCITRDLKWGTPVPKPGFTDKVFYVWFDAPIGYISITANYTKDWEKWWKNPKDVQLYQFMGKDNIPFHTVIFPSTLLGTGENWTLLHHINTTEFLNYENGKFSKSRASGVFGDDVQKTGIPSEIWRYYLLANRPESADSFFLWDDFTAKTNTELLSNLGNFVNRPLTFVSKFLGGVIPEGSEPTAQDREWIGQVVAYIALYINQLEDVHIKEALHTVMEVSRLGNKFMQDNKPWELLEPNRLRCGLVIRLLSNLVYWLSVILDPFMPSLAEKISQQLNLPVVEEDAPLCVWDEKKFLSAVVPGHRVGQVGPLIKPIDGKLADELREQYKGKQEHEFPLLLKVGRITKVVGHSEDENLYVLTISVDVERQVVARIRAHYPKPGDLLNKNVVVLCNIPPITLKNVASQGMILTGVHGKGKEERVRIIEALAAEPGTQVLATDCKFIEKKNFDKKELSKLDLKVGDFGQVTFFGHPLTAGESPILVPSLPKGAKIQ